MISSGVKIRELPSLRPHLLDGAIILWALVSAPFAVYMAVEAGRGWALTALLAGPVAATLRRHPAAAATALVVGASILRLSFVGFSGSDPIAVSQWAAERALSGLDPYAGHVYPSGTVYPYGPLGLLTYQAGVPGEFIGITATSVLLIWARAWLTLAFMNSWPQFLYTPVIGNNDYSVGFLLALAIVYLRLRPMVGMGLLATAIAVKPYAAAWFLPALGYVGFGAAAVVGIATSLVLWSPVLLLWGLPSFMDSIVALEQGKRPSAAVPSWAFADIPALRLLVVPLSALGVILRSWTAMALLGAAGFIAFLGFAPWAHHANLGAVLPIVGLVAEWRPQVRHATERSVPAISAVARA